MTPFYYRNHIRSAGVIRKSRIMTAFSSYLLPVSGGRGLPELPPEGLVGPEDLKESNRGIVLPRVDSVIGPEKYSYTKTNIRRNIYRIPIS
jgi:hypothetical protein